MKPYRTGANLTGLQELVRNHVRPGMRVLEIGAFIGDATNVFLDAGANVDCVDPWNEQMPSYRVEGDILEAWEINTGNRAFPRIGTSDEVLPKMIGLKFDLVYIDAVHTYEAVKNDIINSLPLLNVGGVISGHDYSVHFPGVMQAVNEYAATHGLTVNTYPDTSWTTTRG